ncbi:MAG: glycoside hydrolase family 26 protein [Anaerolineae bacterium]
MNLTYWKKIHWLCMAMTLAILCLGLAVPIAAQTPTPSLSIGHVAVGAFTQEIPHDNFAALDRLGQLADHPMHLALWFQAWGDGDASFYSDYVKLAAEKGYISVITWEPWKRAFEDRLTVQPEYALETIAAGKHDDYIRSWARDARDTGVPIILRFAHEQSTEPGVRSWYPWQGDPENFKAAFRRIVAIFREEGATNVAHLWSAMWLHKWAALYYPGDDVVDYVGTTELNHGTVPDEQWAKWRTFDEMFAPEYQAALQWNKPIILTELASAEQGGNKAQWLRDCFASFQTHYPLVVGVLLVEIESDREWPAINWSVTSSPAALQAFKEVIHDPYFR